MALTAEADLADPESRALADGGLEALLGFHLRMANVAMYRDYATTLSPLDLTQRQVAPLALTHANCVHRNARRFKRRLLAIVHATLLSAVRKHHHGAQLRAR